MEMDTLAKAEVWRKDIMERVQSGLTVREWCSQHNIGLSAYYYRLRVVGRADRLRSADNADSDAVSAAKPAEGFREIHPSQNAVPATRPSSDVALRIRRGATIIELAADAPDPVLSMMQEVLSHAL